MPILIEACVGTVTSALTAQAAGAHRLELCSNLVEGGVTPSLGLLERVLTRVSIPVHVLIRPRGGDFLFEENERAVMLRDVALAKAAGARGVVVGALGPDGRVDAEVTGLLLAAARPMSVTFHRAFDLARDPAEALDELIALGADRLLTSGQAPNALEGVTTIAALVKQSAGRVVILAGGGVNETNVARVIRETGVREIHVGASGTGRSGMLYQRNGVFMGKRYEPDEYCRTETDADRLGAIVRAVVSG